MVLYDYEKQHIKQLRSGLAECMVLLKSNGDFPLEEADKIALYGSGARRTIKGGTGSGEVNSRYFDTVEMGLKKGGFVITSEKWLSAYDRIYEKAKQNFIQEIKANAKRKHTLAIYEGMGAVMPEPEYEFPITAKAEVAIYVLSRVSGEGNDRKITGGDVLLTETEKRDILACAKKYKKFMLVLNVGGPVDLSPVAEVENILVMSQLGVETGRALADVLLGKASPSGKLTTSWAAVADFPEFTEFGNSDETRYKEGVYVGYRYYDSMGIRNQFPFGYGLSYARFKISEEKLSVEGSKVLVSVNVKNTGKYAGKEVVQVYVSVPAGELDQPYQTLAAFKKTSELQPKESEEVVIAFDMKEIASYDAKKAAYVLEEGAYIVRVGNSSVDTKICGVIDLEETVVVRQVKNALGKPDFEDWTPEKVRRKVIGKNTERIALAKDVFETEEIAYDKTWEIDPKVAKLTEEELTLLHIGAFPEKASALSIIGAAAHSVAGAAGETASVKGIHAMVMADGPAGVRLCKQYFVDKKGEVHGFGNLFPESFADFIPPVATSLAGMFSARPKAGMEIKDQYATAIPIGTAIAQSWNLEFAELCGDIVGDEMKRFGVHLWLAPALNIHRSILCGRNFEYFSEDPLISGCFAAALTKGVQAHAGCGTTIKHYAANNQETNRYNNNSQVSERAMREIYLRGFEICVKEAQPKAVMTSYNLLNGVHTAESRDLIENILRQEFGFQGIVMTDWVIPTMTGKNSKYPQSQPEKVAAAGGDLFMPGGKKEWQKLLKALKESRVSKEQLQINATRICKMSEDLTNQ